MANGHESLAAMIEIVEPLGIHSIVTAIGLRLMSLPTSAKSMCLFIRRQRAATIELTLALSNSRTSGRGSQPGLRESPGGSRAAPRQKSLTNCLK